MHSPTRLIPILSIASALSAAAQNAPVSIEKETDMVRIKIGAELFTELLFGDERSKPIFYPIFGPGQLPMTRDYPIKNAAPGEASDHPHHESLWYTHGDVNGVSFWHLGKDAGTIKQTSLKIDGDTITTTDDWLGPDKKRICSDDRTMKFSTLPGGARVIDFTITIKASDGEVKIGDTKEGSMGIRTHYQLRIDKGATATNSAGDKGKNIWGKPAAWVNYQNKIGDKPAGIAIFDHPTNPRHPSTWHARDYGLVAANPFGAHDFSKAKKGAGDMLVKSGESVTFHYAFVFHRGSDEKSSVADLYAAWSKK